jgi:hypothetical protein
MADDFDPEDLMRQLEENGDGMVMPVHIYGGGLDDEQRKGLDAILEAIDRAQIIGMTLVQAGSSPSAEYEGLYRVCLGITDASAQAVYQVVSSGKADPVSAIRGIFAGIGAMMFIAGQEYEKEQAKAPEDRRPVQPLREKTPEPSPEEQAEMKDLFARLGEVDIDSEGF